MKNNALSAPNLRNFVKTLHLETSSVPPQNISQPYGHLGLKATSQKSGTSGHLHLRSSIIWLSHHMVSRCYCITSSSSSSSSGVVSVSLQKRISAHKEDWHHDCHHRRRRSEKRRRDIRRGSMTYHHDVVHPIKNIRNISCLISHGSRATRLTATSTQRLSTSTSVDRSSSSNGSDDKHQSQRRFLYWQQQATTVYPTSSSSWILTSSSRNQQICQLHHQHLHVAPWQAHLHL